MTALFTHWGVCEYCDEETEVTHIRGAEDDYATDLTNSCIDCAEFYSRLNPDSVIRYVDER